MRATRPASVVATVFFAIVSIAVASSVWWPVYQSPPFVTLAIAAILLGTTVALVGALPLPNES